MGVRDNLAWTLFETLKVSCVVDTINKARVRRETDQPLLIRSDRGSQYTTREYSYCPAYKGFQCSYSCVCW